ncbi:acyltransferase [Flagelloscypha sp. PMI_526]|nr:acyltransferase [Flagelloscypha sp. PMI_526]
MEVKLVYRFLRQISVWSVEGLYSQHQVDGAENIPRDAPLVLAATHANELLDVALLAITNQRFVSFWAKGSSFKNPLAGPFLVSSGALPVNRNPNAVNSNNGNNNGQGNLSNADLFKSTIEAMARGYAIGVFPEGTSYTYPRIMQILPGAAWAAVEYALARPDSNPGPVIVPVTNVYTDKSQFQSRIRTRYGAPIYVSQYLARHPDDPKQAVKDIMDKVKGELFEHSINAPDWDTLYAAEVARSLMYGDESNILLDHWVKISQRLVNLLTTSPTFPDSMIKTRAKTALCRYKALQSYCNLSYSSLDEALPTTWTHLPSRKRMLLKVIRHLGIATLHPMSLAFVPLLPIFAPAYLFGWIAGKFIATPGEPEGQAEHKALVGGFGLGVGLSVTFSFLWKQFLKNFANNLTTRVQKMGFSVACAYLFALVTWRSHRVLVRGAYTRLTTALSAIRLLLATLSPSKPLTEAELEPFTHPPTPVPNAFLKKLTEEKETVKYPKPSLSTRSRLIKHHLVAARRDAIHSLRMFLEEEQVDVRVLEGYEDRWARGR